MTHPRKELPYFADTDLNNYDRRWIERSAFSVTAVQEIVAGFISTFKDFPPRQKRRSSTWTMSWLRCTKQALIEQTYPFGIWK